MAPYKLQLIQQLKNTDKPARREFCVAMPEKLGDDRFDDRLVFSDEATSPNLTSRDFLGGFVKRLVYVPPLSKNVDALKIRITEAVATIDKAMLKRVGQELVYRFDVCRVTNGAQIEHS